MKLLSGAIMSVFLFSGCGVSNSIESVKDSVSSISSGSAETAELQTLENLPEGTFAFASRNTTGLQSKADIILSLKQYLPEEMKKDLEENFPENFQKEFLSGYMLHGVNIAGIVRPKVDEILFASFPTNPDAIAQKNICAMGKGVISKERINAILREILKNEKISGDISEETQNEMKKFQDNPDTFISEISDQWKTDPDYLTFEKYANFSIITDKKNIIVEIATKACDDADTKIFTEFSDAVNTQDRMNQFISVDKKFFAPFLAKGNIAVVKIAIAEGEKQMWAEAEKNGLDVEQLKQLKSEILAPWERTNFVKILKNFQKFSSVSGYIDGNFADRESETLLEFSDESSAELVAEIQQGKIATKKLWLHDGAKMTAKVSQNGGTVYSYVKFENTEYPALLTNIGGPETILIGITVVGILTTATIELYTGAQKKARDAERINDLQMIKTGLMQAYADESKYPENLEVLVERRYLSELPLDPKYYYEYDYRVSSDGQGFIISANPESSSNYGSDAFEVKMNFSGNSEETNISENSDTRATLKSIY